MGEVVQLRKAAVPVWGPILKVAVVMFVLTKAAGMAYEFFFGMFAATELTPILQAAHIDAAFAFEMQLLQVTLAPVGYAIMTAMSPLVGWWIYSRIDTGGQAAVMWGAAALNAVASIALGIGLSGAMVANPLALVLGMAIMVVYTVFFMGLGFIPAQLFKVKL
jgi:hypothetical protein